MGCAAIVTAVGGPAGAVDRAQALLVELESRWSRFRADSELHALHATAGDGPVEVSPLTFSLVERMVHGWRHTGGAFDPTIADALVAAGYDRSFELLPASGPGPVPASGPRPVPACGTGAAPAPGCGGIRLDRAARRVALPAGVRLDPGGIGKGLAADLVVAKLLRLGCDGAMAGIGGDIRVCGLPPAGTAWRAEVADPEDRRVAFRVLGDGAVATSSTALRRWRAPDGNGEAHHVIDPSTGRPAQHDLVLVSVSAGRGWWAEVLATAALASGLPRGASLLHEHGAEAVLADAAGRYSVVGRAFELLPVDADRYAAGVDLAGFDPAAFDEVLAS